VAASSRRGRSPEVPKVDPIGLGRGDQAFGEVECVVDDLRLRGGILSHVVQDRALGPRGHDGSAIPFDPRARAPSATSLVPAERIEGLDPAGTSELAETQDHHARLSRHWTSMPRAGECTQARPTAGAKLVGAHVVAVFDGGYN
jgi:hypothetical protein